MALTKNVKTDERKKKKGKGQGTGNSLKAKKSKRTLGPSASKTNNTKEHSSANNKMSGQLQGSVKKKANESSRRRKVPKNSPKYQFANGEMVDGVNQYKVASNIRKSQKTFELDVYIVNDVEQNEEFRMKTSNLEFQVLKTEAALLRRLEKKPGDKCFVSISEYGTLPKNNLEYLIVAPYGATLYEITKKVLNGENLSLACGITVALQMLKAIRDLHSIGYVHRNIRPSAFTCGIGEDDATVYLQDFRNVRKFEEQKKHVTARTTVKMYGTMRYSSRASQNNKDLGRKDDLESFIYTVFYLIDKESLTWKKEKTPEGVLKEKEQFMLNSGQNQFAKVPRSIVPIICVVFGLDFSSVPDYESIKNVLVEIQNQEKLTPKSCDWKGKSGLNEIEGDTNRSVDCKVTGDRDFQPKGAKKKKATRKKLSSGDVILGVGAQSGWKVINLLGSGGFGDVYKVHRE
uniref:Protein kinase domain-containing protein n=1 Tax=Caenorhabditis japonica TaxID=281687 RepID=A0A8R1IBF5_CAEJA